MNQKGFSPVFETWDEAKAWQDKNYQPSETLWSYLYQTRFGKWQVEIAEPSTIRANNDYVAETVMP